ncbi:hypothetical protein Poli38472_012673 [Pythium oligandrum]|uniref:Uncharacterized protein n=1 Tax=Pythium oligandrum TaxID=41045 RepID=A0A8K1CG12_PYTOL|nr:hypothetical protein Poli38472_012673 [Pythium oligandrum]|eukprot:TMW61482.1 hypothetical protein Poli38472_012673 [Pythium oligandrum]
MEDFYQYVGRYEDAGGASQLLDQEKLYVYSSPRECAIDRCGELPVGAYFACSELLYYEDQCWMKTRRGYFSNTKQNGYLRVECDWSDQLAAKQRRCAAFYRPRRFKNLRQLPKFPAFLCARERITLSRIPSFQTSTSSSSAHLDRQLPAASVFQATECRFNDDFTQLALKITSPFGVAGWIHVSYHETLVEVDDPRKPLDGPVYVQNIAPRAGKWMGELPVRGIPTLQAPRLGNLASFQIATAVERKLVKDHVWLRLEGFQSSSSENNQEGGNTEPIVDAWIVEHHANTGERVTVPWGADDIHDRALNRDDYEERYYRNIYGRRALPLRKAARLDSEVVGELSPGAVVISTRRVLNDRGQVWIRVALASSAISNQDEDTDKRDVEYGYAIQSSAKTNVCMLQEIPTPGKMTPKQYFQLVLRSDSSSDAKKASLHAKTDGSPATEVMVDATRLGAFAEPSTKAKTLFYIKNRAIVSAIGSIYNSEQKTMWLQVLREDVDPVLIEEKKLLPHEQREESSGDGARQYVVYVPVCHPEPSRAHEVVMFGVGRELQKTTNPSKVEAERKQAGARVVFSGRASKLFGSQLLRPSTTDIAPPSPLKPLSDSPVASAAGEDQAQHLKEEIDEWQRLSAQQSLVSVKQYFYVAGGMLASCFQRPCRPCLQQRQAQQMYARLDQDEEDER